MDPGLSFTTVVGGLSQPIAMAFDESVKGICDRTSPEGVPLKCATNGRTCFDTTFIE